MRCARWITLVWPGLTELWLAGAWWGLAIGCSFAWLVNLAVVSTFVWTELLGPCVANWGMGFACSGLGVSDAVVSAALADDPARAQPLPRTCFAAPNANT